MSRAKGMISASLAAAALAVGVVLPAQASAQVSTATCWVSGKATTSGVRPIGGTGTWNFQSGTGSIPVDMVCGESVGGEWRLVQTTLASGGTFGNLICGSGWADGANGSLFGGWDYHITFGGGKGTLVFTIPSDVSGFGSISITPLFGPGEPNTTTCTTSFDVEGVLWITNVPSTVPDSTFSHDHL